MFCQVMSRKAKSLTMRIKMRDYAGKMCMCDYDMAILSMIVLTLTTIHQTNYVGNCRYVIVCSVCVLVVQRPYFYVYSDQIVI